MNNKVTLQDLAEQLSAISGQSKKLSEGFLRALTEIVEEALAKDGIAKVKGIGTFKIVAIEERKSVSVTDGSAVIIPAHKKITFTPEKELKEAVNKPFEDLETYILPSDGPVDGPFVDDEDEEEADEIANSTDDIASTPVQPYSTPVVETPQYTAPVTETPQYTAPVTETPQYTAPVTETLQYTAPVAETPQYTAPVTDTPQYTAPVTETPQHTAPVTETPQYTAPVTETPQYTAPATEAPQYTAPVTETPQYTAPVAETPQYTAPVTETPQYTAPVTKTPQYTAPVTETPQYTAPVTETPQYTAPANDQASTVNDPIVEKSEVPNTTVPEATTPQGTSEQAAPEATTITPPATEECAPVGPTPTEEIQQTTEQEVPSKEQTEKVEASTTSAGEQTEAPNTAPTGNSEATTETGGASEPQGKESTEKTEPLNTANVNDIKQKGRPKKRKKEKNKNLLIVIIILVLLILACLFYAFKGSKGVSTSLDEIKSKITHLFVNTPVKQNTDTLIPKDTTPVVKPEDEYFDEKIEDMYEAAQADQAFPEVVEIEQNWDWFEEGLKKFIKKEYPKINFEVTGEPAIDTIRNGQTLASLSRKHYDGVKDFWVYIYLYNKDVIRRPDNVSAGTVVKIPQLDESVINPDSYECINAAKDVKESYLRLFN
jgi:nucleoid DNA-binding protein